MPFPFFPGGLLLALGVLGGALLLFGVALKALDWTIDATRGTAIVGIVFGLRDWQERPATDERTARPSALAVPASVEELVGSVGTVERVARPVIGGRGKP